MHHVPNKFGIDKLKSPYRDKIVAQVGEIKIYSSQNSKQNQQNGNVIKKLQGKTIKTKS